MTLLVKRTQPTVPAFANEFFGRDFFSDFFDSHTGVGVPSVNVAENNIEYRIDLAAPGLTKEDFNIGLEKNVLTVSAEKKTGNDDAQEKYIRREFSFNSISRSFRLSNDVNTEKISATCKDGILSVILPKKEEAVEKGPRSIKIK